MNATPNYQLSQWDAEDRVQRVDFNADNAKIDAAVKGVDRRVDSLSSSVSTINTSLSKKASTTSLNSAVSRISALESGKVDKSAHSSDVSALRSENCWVKLGEKYTTADGQTAKIAIPNISAYRELEIVFRGASATSSSCYIMLVCNDITSSRVFTSHNCFNNAISSMYLANLTNTQGGGTVRLFPLWPDSQTALHSTYIAKITGANKAWSGGQYEAVFEEITWDSIKSLSIFASPNAGGLAAGSGMSVYGLKK